ncbi:MAG: 2,5-diamino-6-(ribosylamino)-4(3H)-pyrimidinone 5'-phosphate reductase [Candidatus Methanomethylophilaceae archaeon]|nr:2,5-diamino-6-(ribosylamino)-4(3H)-pyrimidinone 5'-phosphate reductase [Candidatus Methanomethylophilaceae archaeon]
MNRPIVHVNCAMSADGKIAGSDRAQVRISSAEDMQRVKGMRMDHDAILVGIGTVLYDDPHLTVKGLKKEQNPIRVVLDSRGRTPDNAQVLDDRARTVIVTSEDCDKTWEGSEVIRAGRGRVNLRMALEALHDLGIGSVMVEGGGEVIASFFENGLVDEYTVFVGSMIIGGRNAPTPADGDGRKVGSNARLHLEEYSLLGDGVLLRYTVQNDHL